MNNKVKFLAKCAIVILVLAAVSTFVVAKEETWRTATFVDQHGSNVKMSELLEKPTVLTFFFTGCGSYCPATTMAMAMLQEELNDEVGSDSYQIVSVTLTPFFDQPEDVVQFSDRFHPDYANWSFLTGSPHLIQELIAEAGVAVVDYSTETFGDVDHTTDVYFLRPNEDFVGRAGGLPLDDNGVTKFVRQAVAVPDAPS